METADKEESTNSLNSPNPFQKRTLWKAITGISMAIIAVLLVSAVIILGKILSVLQPVLVPLAIAAILSYLLAPGLENDFWEMLKTLEHGQSS